MLAPGFWNKVYVLLKQSKETQLRESEMTAENYKVVNKIVG